LATIRTHETVVLEEASGPSLFTDDDYLRCQQAKSILCLPLIEQEQLTGLLHLESRREPHRGRATLR
jgi:GAF domain-containing protein